MALDRDRLSQAINSHRKAIATNGLLENHRTNRRDWCIDRCFGSILNNDSHSRTTLKRELRIRKQFDLKPFISFGR